MKHLVIIYEETKKLNSDLTQYVFSTDFFKQKERFFCFISLIPMQLNLFSVGIKLFV